MFTNNLNRAGYIEILNEHLFPFMRNFNNGNNRLLQDNSSTHRVSEQLNNNQIRWVIFL